MTKFFDPGELGALIQFHGTADWRRSDFEFLAATLDKFLERSFGNEYQVVMFWKETMLAERERADAAERELEALRKEIDEAPVVYGQKDSAREAGWQYFGTDPISDIGLYRARLVRIEEMKKP